MDRNTNANKGNLTADQHCPPPQYASPQPQIVTTQQPVYVQNVVVGPACAYCGGPLNEEFTACGILLAICFFPLGVLCCLAMQEKRCVNCGKTN